MIFVGVEVLLNLPDVSLGIVLGLGALGSLAISLGIALSILTHALDLVFGKTAVALDLDALSEE